MDIPYIHCPDRKESEWFSEALNEDNAYYDLLHHPAVQGIIDFRWEASQSYITWNLLYPYLIFMMVYLYHVMIIFDPHSPILEPEEDTKRSYWTNIVLIALISIFACYFFIKEIQQLNQSEGISDYFSEVWNWLDIFPPMLIAVVFGLNGYQEW